MQAHPAKKKSMYGLPGLQSVSVERKSSQRLAQIADRRGVGNVVVRALARRDAADRLRWAGRSIGRSYTPVSFPAGVQSLVGKESFPSLPEWRS